MLRCGYCEKICDNYEDWLSHLVSEEHQSNIGISDTFEKHSKDPERNERSLIVTKFSPKTRPYDVVCHFAIREPLGFVTDAYAHIFPHVDDKFFMIVYDQRKFAQRIEREQHLANSEVQIISKTSISESEWSATLERSFFYRRHENIKRKLIDMNWDTQMDQLLKFISLDDKGYELRESVMEEVEILIREEFHEAKVIPFGSCTTWLADVNADLDFFVDAFGDGGRCDLSSEKKLEIMNEVITLLKKKYDGENVFPNRHDRVPTIKLSHPSGLKVEFSFENCLSVQNSKMIKLLAKLDYRIRRLLIFLRYWAKYHNLIGPHAVKSYALIMMVFVYLRKEKLIPSVYELQHIEGINQFTVCNWNAAYCGSRERTFKYLPWLKGFQNAPSDEGICHEVMKLAYGFFKEYSQVDFSKQVICPLTGSFIPKKSFESQYGVDLPKEMELLKANLVTGICEPFKTEKPLCVQDPFALNVNITGSCTTTEIVTRFKAACCMGADALKPYISNYGLAGTESFLDLTCQPITKEKTMEVIMNGTEGDPDPNNHDHLAYVKTEATSSTHEDEIWIPDNNTAHENATVAFKDSFREHDGQADTRFSLDNEFSRDVSFDRKRRDREQDDGRPLKIHRVSIYDNEKERERGRRSDNYYYNKEANEEAWKKSMKSAVVVPVSFKSEATSSSSPKRPSNSRDKSENIWETGATSSTSPWTATSDDHKDKSYKDIVVVLENKSRDFLNSNGASLSSAPVIYNSPQEKQEPKVTFVHRSPTVTYVPPPPQPPHPPPPPPPPPPQAKKVAPIEMEESEIEEDEEEDEENDELEQTNKFLTTLHHQIEPPEEEDVRFDVSNSSYGYERAVQAQRQQHPKAIVHYVPPGARNIAPTPTVVPVVKRNISQSQSQPRLSFPTFAIFTCDSYRQQYLHIIRDLSVKEPLREHKMRVLWCLNTSELFVPGYFFPKMYPLFAKASFREVEICETKEVFGSAKNAKSGFLKSEADKYMYLNNEGKVGKSGAAGEMYDPQPKILKPDPIIGPNDYEYRAGLMLKLGKVPANVRKPWAKAFYFSCYFEHIEVLCSQWTKISRSLPLSPTRSPLDIFGNMCQEIAKAAMTSTLNDHLINVKLVVACDTTDQVPGIYFGFQNDLLEDDPKHVMQESVHQFFEIILKDIIASYNSHRLAKFFK